MRRNVSLAGLAAALLVGIGSLSIGLIGQRSFATSAQENASKMDVKIDNFSFGLAMLTVQVGTTVTWTNRDDIPHIVVSSDEPGVQVQSS